MALLPGRARSPRGRRNPGKRVLLTLARGPIQFAVLLALAAGPLVTACGPLGPGSQQCPPHVYELPPSTSTSLIAVISRSSAASAQWGLRELAGLLPLVARPGLEFHVLYTQDADDLTEGGGDGGPPQVLATGIPNAATFRVRGAPAEPRDPTLLSAELYCQRMRAWQGRAAVTLRAAAAERIARTAAWAGAAAARLTTLAGRPVPDTAGAEAGGEVDASASTFAAAEVAEGSPHPTILFLGGLSALQPPAQRFRFPARLVDLVRSDDLVLVLRSEMDWAHWSQQNGGTFVALSANDDATSIVEAINGGR